MYEKTGGRRGEGGIGLCSSDLIMRERDIGLLEALALEVSILLHHLVFLLDLSYEGWVVRRPRVSYAAEPPMSPSSM